VSFSSWSRRLVTAPFGKPRGAADGSRRGRWPAVLAAAGVAIAAVVGIVFAVGPGKTLLRTTAQQSGTGSGGAGARSGTKGPAVPLRVVSVTPSAGSGAVNGAEPLRVVFSAPLAGDSPMPALSPAVPGTWHRTGDAAVFTPQDGFAANTNVTVTVPAGASGVRSAAGARAGGGGRLSSPVTRSFTTGSFSTLRLQQLLAQLGYLPLSWAPAGNPISASDARAQVAAAYAPPAGTFTWQGGYPSALHALWQQGTGNIIDTGAIRAFEFQNGLTMDGVAGPKVWQTLQQDVTSGKHNPSGYTYALASKASPETLTIWHDGQQVLHSLANTGIAASPTADGTYPVYERLPSQVMKGTNPNGTRYADPVQNVSYFNGGDAVHYIARASYGWPQSLGCVELPLSQSAVAYQYLTYGSLVTVA
jgi:peptidoglycan hydrolase-like protein with peptidoglycan-binding domain